MYFDTLEKMLGFDFGSVHSFFSGNDTNSDILTIPDVTPKIKFNEITNRN